MDEQREPCAAPVDPRRRAVPVARQLDRPTVEVAVAAEVGQPVRDLERRVAQRPGHCVTQTRRLRVPTQLDHELADRRPRESRTDQPHQEDDRRQSGYEEHRAADLLHSRPAEQNREKERRDQHQRQHERVDHQIG